MTSACVRQESAFPLPFLLKKGSPATLADDLNVAGIGFYLGETGEKTLSTDARRCLNGDGTGRITAV